MDFVNEQNLNFESLSGAESAEETIEEEDRSNEINELFAAAFSNESFGEANGDDDEDDDDDDDSEHSYAQDVHQTSSIHMGTNNIGISNSNGLKANVVATDNNHSRTVSHMKKTATALLNGGFPTTTTTANTITTNTPNENGLNSFFNGIGVENHHDGFGEGYITNGNNSNNIHSDSVNGRKVVRFQQQISPHRNTSNNHNSTTNSNSNNNNNDTGHANRSNGSGSGHGNGRQSERAVDEIEVTNPTISLLHQNHCPQNGDDPSSELWTESGNDLEQLKTLYQLRERQCQRSEENVKALEKDKRSLNHQIGLMKTEMIQMKKQQDDLEKLLQQREGELFYLNNKMTEAIEEYERAQQGEQSAKEEINQLRDENEKLHQQVKLLSSIGSSTQQAEIDQVVRSMRDKHSKEVAVWQETVADLESQLLAYKRQQHSIHDESIVVEKENVSIQTDPILPQVSPVVVATKPVSTSDFGQVVNFMPQPQPPQVSTSFKDKSQNVTLNSTRESGGAGDSDKVFNKSLENARLEKWKQAFAKSEEEKNRLLAFYEKEMEEYKTKLAILPAQLYKKWQAQQEELGLLYSANNVSSATITPVGTPGSKNTVTTRDMSTETNRVSHKAANVQTDEGRQSNGNSSDSGLVKRDSTLKNIVSRVSYGNFSATICDSASQTEKKQHSHIVIQTEETFETYKVLGTLIEQWAKEIGESTDRAELAEKEVKLRREELKKMFSKYRELKRAYINAQKKWQEREREFIKKLEESTDRYINCLSTVHSKLDIFDE